MKYLFSIFLLILCSCSSEKEKTIAFHFDEKKFKSEWDIWKSQDIKNYSFTMKGKLPYTLYPIAKAKGDYYGAIPMYDYEVKITVKDGVMNSFKYIGEVPHNERGDGSIFEPEYTSISDMYQKMYDNIKKSELGLPNHTNGCLISIREEIEYNHEFHYIARYEPILEINSNCEWDTSVHEVLISDFAIGND